MSGLSGLSGQQFWIARTARGSGKWGGGGHEEKRQGAKCRRGCGDSMLKLTIKQNDIPNHLMAFGNSGYYRPVFSDFSCQG
jgi:hypothetical protein